MDRLGQDGCEGQALGEEGEFGNAQACGGDERRGTGAKTIKNQRDEFGLLKSG